VTIVVMMGVSGCGKTTIGRALSDRLGWQFLEGDTLHSAANVAKMAGGTPLSDADRVPWLHAIAAVMQGWDKAGKSGVVTCSALKRTYRNILLGKLSDVRLVYLQGDERTIAGRLAAREGHFMPPALLNSQFSALEVPGDEERPLIVSITQSPSVIIAELVAALS
jgi:gluconokinase